MTLILLPNLLAPLEDHTLYLPISVDTAVKRLDGLIAESESGGRRFLKRFQTKKKPHLMPIALIDEEVNFLLAPVLEGETWGVVADAGLPGLADPGARLVKRARQLKIPVEALVGPSSITLALIQSGLGGQQFFFHGYIPKDPKERERALISWEKIPEITHLFMETPYRNLHTYETCIATLKDETLFCVASNLTAPDQWIHTDKIAKWKKSETPPPIQKKPTLFLFSSGTKNLGHMTK